VTDRGIGSDKARNVLGWLVVERISYTMVSMILCFEEEGDFSAKIIQKKRDEVLGFDSCCVFYDNGGRNAECLIKLRRRDVMT